MKKQYFLIIYFLITSIIFGQSINSEKFTIEGYAKAIDIFYKVILNKDSCNVRNSKIFVEESFGEVEYSAIEFDSCARQVMNDYCGKDFFSLSYEEMKNYYKYQDDAPAGSLLSYYFNRDLFLPGDAKEYSDISIYVMYLDDKYFLDFHDNGRFINPYTQELGYQPVIPFIVRDNRTGITKHFTAYLCLHGNKDKFTAIDSSYPPCYSLGIDDDEGNSITSFMYLNKMNDK